MAHGSLHQFKAFLERRNARKDKNSGKFEKESPGYNSAYVKPEYDFPKLNEKDLEKVKMQIREKMKRDNLRQLLIFAGVLILITAIILIYTGE